MELVADALKRHSGITVELVDLLGELAQVRAAIATTRRDAWQQYRDLAVTERREATAAATAELTAEAETLQGDVDICRARLAHEALVITVLKD